MAGSSMRNSVHRRNHKERAQPLARAKLGLLEKHGDYVKRARDYHSKRDRIKKLREKVAFRNKDEFYWGMVKQRTKDGVHLQTRGNGSLPNEVARLLKSQDSGYVRTQIAADESKVEALKTQLHSLTNLIGPTNTPSQSISDSEDATESDLDRDGLDLRRLVEAGVIVLPQSSSIQKSGSAKTKGKGRDPALARNHVVFANARDELLSYEKSAPPQVLALRDGEPPTMSKAAADDGEDLGWITKKRKSGRKPADPVPLEGAELTRLELEQDKEESALMEEARAYRTALLIELSARVERVAALKGTLAHMALERQMMVRSSVVVKREKEQIVADDDHEGGRGGMARKVEWRPPVVKWRAERRR